MTEILSIYLYIIFFINIFFGLFYFFIFVKVKFNKQPPPKPYPLDLTVIIPSYNCEKTLESTVNSINNSDYPKNKIKIFIVNDGSTDKTIDICNKLKSKYSNVQVFNKKNSGKADSVNFGLKKAVTPLVCVLDSDTEIKSDLLSKSSGYFRDENIYAAVTRFIPSNRRNFIEKMQDIEYTFTAFFRKLVTHLKSLPVAPGFAVFRRELFLKYGYFDKDNITEDFEIGLRIQKNHHDIAFVGDSYAKTSVPSGLKSLYKQRLRWYYGGLYNYKKYRTLFFNKIYGDLSMFVMPSGLAIMIISALSLILTVYNFFNYVIDKGTLILNGWIPAFEFNIYNDLILLTNLKFVLAGISLLSGICIYFFVKNEVENKLSFFNYLLMIFIFIPIQAVFYLASFVYLIIGKKPHW